MGRFDWECTECGELQSKHNQYFDGKCETCNFRLKNDVEDILITYWVDTIGQEPDNYEDLVQEVYEVLLNEDKTEAEQDYVIEQLHNVIKRAKDSEISYCLMKFFSQIGMDRPSNFEEIITFVINDVRETADKENWHDGDVTIAFRRWIEAQTNDSYSQDY